MQVCKENSLTESEKNPEKKSKRPKDPSSAKDESSASADFIPKLRSDSVHIKLEAGPTKASSGQNVTIKPNIKSETNHSKEVISSKDSDSTKTSEINTDSKNKLTEKISRPASEIKNVDNQKPSPKEKRTPAFIHEAGNVAQDKDDALSSLSKEPPKPIAKTLTAHEQYRENPRVLYPNSEKLFRPLRVPTKERKVAIIMVVAACIVSAALLFFYFDATTNEPRRQQEILQQELSKDVKLNLPPLLEFVTKNNKDIQNELNSTGETIYERKPLEGSVDAEVIKLPADMTLEQATGLYAVGLNKLKPTQFVSLMNGSWVLDVDRKSGVNMALHYADFKSTSLRQAIDSAIDDEKFTSETEIQSGDDDGNGNAYSTGTLEFGGKKYSWTVSALPLTEMYSVSGIPSDSVYVGIRIKSVAQ